MTCQTWRAQGTGSRWCQELPAAPVQGAKGPHIASEGAIGQLTTHHHQGAGPGHSHMGMTGSLWKRPGDRDGEGNR